MEKIYLLKNRDRTKFKLFTAGKTNDFRSACEKCHIAVPDHRSGLKEPFVIEWIKGGSKIIGDFSWHDGGFDIIVSNRVKNYLISNKFECNFGQVNAEKPKTKTEDKKIILEPDLYRIMPVNYFDLNIRKSSLEIKEHCEFCSTTEYKFKMENLVIDRDVIKECKLFSLNQFALSSAVYVTETGLKTILSQNYTNFEYREAGWIE